MINKITCIFEYTNLDKVTTNYVQTPAASYDFQGLNGSQTTYLRRACLWSTLIHKTWSNTGIHKTPERSTAINIYHHWVSKLV